MIFFCCIFRKERVECVRGDHSWENSSHQQRAISARCIIVHYSWPRWCRSNERCLLELCPEILMVDVTHGKNSETRPLCVSASIDVNMKTFTPIHAFLPSECQWVLHWLWASAIPSLLGIKTIRCIQLVLSNGYPKIYIPITIMRERLYPSAIYGLFSFRLVTQPLQPVSHITSISVLSLSISRALRPLFVRALQMLLPS